MSRNKIHNTLAIRELKANGIEFEAFNYEYEEKGGTAQTARELNVDEYKVIKTLVLDANGALILMLMHGNKEVSLKGIANVLGVKNVMPADAKKAMNATGYLFGGTSPFGTKKKLPIYAETTIFNLNEIYINGGKRGFIVKINPITLEDIFQIHKVNVAI